MQNPGMTLNNPIKTRSLIVPNTVEDALSREAGEVLTGYVNIAVSSGSYALNAYSFTGAVLVRNQWSKIVAVSSLANCTNFYSDVYDGTTATDITADGITLSNAPVDTFFVKDQVSTQPYSILTADQARVLETLDDKKAGRPFTINAKNGVTNYIRVRLTTNTDIDFTIQYFFEYELLGDNSTLIALSPP